jgi:hypothetical protein
MDVVLLRTLTRKSIIGFGQYSEMSVGQIIDMQKGLYLIWIYFHVEGISFSPEVFDELKLYEKYRISKPGINHDMCIHYEKCRYGGLKAIDPYKYLKVKMRNKKVQGHRQHNREKMADWRDNRGLLQRKNQGHR